MMTLLFKLISGHALADLTLQTDFVATFKNRHAKFPTGETIWPYVLASHCLFHGALVYLSTQSVNLGIAETIAHFVIDFCKCEKLFGFHADQALHIACKFVWAYLAVRGIL